MQHFSASTVNSEQYFLSYELCLCAKWTGTFNNVSALLYTKKFYEYYA